MSISRQLIHGLRNLALPKRADKDVADEVDSFYAEARADFEARGLAPAEAARAARLQMGSNTALREEVRSYGWENAVSGIFLDVRHILRRLRATPGFTVMSIATLALGLGATISIFSVINAVLLKPLPYRNSERLVALWLTAPGVKIAALNMAPSVYFTMADEKRAFDAVAMWTGGRTSISGKDHPEEVAALYATHELLPAIGTLPQIGRSFTAKDDDPKSQRTLMISDGYWRSHFGANPAILGRSLMIEHNQCFIIGVLPREFEFMDSKADVLMPLRLDRASTMLGGFNYRGIGLLKPGITLQQANSDVARMLPIMNKSFPPPPGYSVKMLDDARIAPNLKPLKDDLVGDIGSILWPLMVTVGIVLFIACANVANLLLVRADGRRQELAVRTALGAGWTRIARELLLESVMLGLFSGAVGLGLATIALRLLAKFPLVYLPRAENIHIDIWVVLFAVAISLGFSGLFGLIPVVRYAHPWINKALHSGDRSMSQSKERQRARKLLVIVQVGLALTLLVGSGLMIRTFWNLRRIDPGFRNAGEIQTVDIGIPDEQIKEPERVLRMQEAIADRIAGVAGVRSASITSAVPMDGNESNDPIYAADKVVREGTLPPLRRFKWVSAGYFSTIGQRMITGRDFTRHDTDNALPVALVSENTAREMWGTPKAALGKRIRTTLKDDWFEVIGVVADEHADGVDKPAPTIVYWPLFQKNFEGGAVRVERYVSIVIRTPRAGSVSLENEIQRAIWSVDAGTPLAKTDTLQHLYNRSLARTSFTLILLAIAGGMAVVLGVVGIYAVIAYSVSQRSREIGIRIAIGAPLADIKKLFVHDALYLSTIGCVCGLFMALVLTKMMKSLLFSVSPSDPFTYVAMCAALMSAAFLASYVPARRATHVDPVEALRAD